MSGVLHGVIASLKAAAAAATDSFFKYVTLLANTNETNGAQNNTFLDSSTNAFSITRNGNTTQGTFSPFSQTGWSNYFDGNGDNLSIAHNVALNLSSGDFTLEAWVYWNGANINSVVMDKDGVAASAYPQYQIALNGSGFLRFLFGGGPSVFQTLTSSTAMPKNVWVHVAGVKNGTNMSLYQDGVSVASATQTATITDNARALLIGYSSGQPTNAYFDGYISNARIVKGTAVYTANFTPPTAPLTNITNTSLLTCQSNRFIDNSSNAFTITRNGDVSVQAFSPFNPTAAWSASTNGGSGYFDGTGDYLSVARNNAFFPVANEDFTIEAWVYLTATPGATTAQIVGTGEYGIDSDWSFNIDSSLQATFYINAIVTGFTNTTSTLRVNAWNHVAASRSGTAANNLKVFVNGVGQSFTTNSTTVGTGLKNLTLGADQNGDEQNLTGYIADARIVKGTAVYTANFTPPTAPLTAITNTSLLLNFTNAGIYDASTINNAQTVGNAQVSTVQSKWGTTSLAFDGTGDYVVAPSTVRYGYGTGDFTIEFWLYLNTAAADQTLVSNLTSVSSTNPHIYLSGATGTIRYYTASADRITGSALSAGQWYHIAVSRASSSTRMFINGTQTGSTYADSNNYGATAPIGVGTYWSAGSPVGTSTLNGYIDDLRITNGYARYTANFTPPTAAFPTS